MIVENNNKFYKLHKYKVKEWLYNNKSITLTQVLLILRNKKYSLIQTLIKIFHNIKMMISTFYLSLLKETSLKNKKLQKEILYKGHNISHNLLFKWATFSLKLNIVDIDFRVQALFSPQQFFIKEWTSVLKYKQINYLKFIDNSPIQYNKLSTVVIWFLVH